MTRAAWGASPRLTRKQEAELRELLGADAERFIDGAHDALAWHAAARAEANASPTPAQVNARLDAVARAAAALALALHRMGDDAGDLIDETRVRRRRAGDRLDERRVLELATDAQAARLPARRGRLGEGAKLNLVRQLAEHYRAATGRRPDRGHKFAAAVLPVLQAARERTTDTRRLIRSALAPKR